jgi:hypothetical protein
VRPGDDACDAYPDLDFAEVVYEIEDEFGLRPPIPLFRWCGPVALRNSCRTQLDLCDESVCLMGCSPFLGPLEMGGPGEGLNSTT